MSNVHPMIASVATAIDAVLYSRLDVLPDAETTQEAARAAIQALMEVDEGMVEAGNAAGGEAYQYQQFGVVVCPPAKAFQAMLKPLLGDEG